MLICGLDPGLHRTGYGIVDADRNTVKLIDAGLITTPVRADLPERLAKLHEELAGIFREYSKIATVAVEELYSHYRHPRTAVLMAHARGVMLLAAREFDIPVMSLPATMVKKALVGYGRAGKQQIQRAVMIRLGIRPAKQIPADVTDALALALCGFEHARGR